MALDINVSEATHFRLGSQWGVDRRFEIELFDALHPDLFYDAFSPTRNTALQRMWVDTNQYPQGKEAFTTLVGAYIDQAKKNLANSAVGIGFATTYGLRHAIPEYGEIEIKLPPHIKERGLWWNDHAKQVFEEKGVEGLINDPTHVCLALGTVQWLDAGNLMAEPRFVGGSLKYSERPDLNLYKHFGVTEKTFAIFPHAKHWSFYEKPFSRMLHGNHLTAKAAYQSLQEIQQLMEMNKIENLVIQGAWLLDPELVNASSPVYNSDLIWLREVFEDSIEIGIASKVNPVLHKYALATSQRRKSAYEAGTYIPKVYATATTLEKLSKALAKTKQT